MKSKSIDKSKIKEIIIPEGITNVDSEVFKNCASLEYLELPESLIAIDEIMISSLNTNLNIFGDCKNLEQVKLSEELAKKSQYLFYNCYNLSIIRYFNGKVERFKMVYEIKEGEKTLLIKDLREIKNLDTLIIPSTIEEIIIDEYDISDNLQCIIGDPKWLSKFPSYQLKKLVIPNFVKKINEKDFILAENLDYIIFEGEINLEGNECHNFEKILNIKCFHCINGASENLKKSKKRIEISEKCKIIDEYSFANWHGITNLFLPDGLRRIERYAFYNCDNLYEIEIPNSLEYIAPTAFKGCTKLRKISCNGKFLNNFPKENLKIIILSEKTEQEHIKDLNNYQNIEVLEVPKHIYNLGVELPKLKYIKCSGHALETLPPDNKINLQTIELYDSELTDNMLNYCNNAQNFIFPQDFDLKKRDIKESYITSIMDIINMDKKIKYMKFI